MQISSKADACPECGLPAEYFSSNDEDTKSAEEIHAEMLDGIKEICKKYDEESYGKLSARKHILMEILGCLDNEIYAIHDASAWNNGKNGFAITDEGFHIKESYGTLTKTSFEDFAKSKNITYDIATYYAGSRPVAYILDNRINKDTVRKMLEELRDYLRHYIK